jgi:hypothetical protein
MLPGIWIIFLYEFRTIVLLFRICTRKFLKLANFLIRCTSVCKKKAAFLQPGIDLNANTPFRISLPHPLLSPAPRRAGDDRFFVKLFLKPLPPGGGVGERSNCYLLYFNRFFFLE